MLAHIGSGMEAYHLHRLASRLQRLARDDRHDVHHDRIGKVEQTGEQRGKRETVKRPFCDGGRFFVERQLS